MNSQLPPGFLVKESPAPSRRVIVEDGGPPATRSGVADPSFASGASRASPQWQELVYAELRRIAVAMMRQERRGHTLQPTALVNETYLRLSSFDSGSSIDRSKFVRIAARAMRRVLMNYARDRKREKRGALTRVDPQVAPDDVVAPRFTFDVLELDAALDRLQAQDRRGAEVVHLRYFAGLTFRETAGILGISVAQAKRDWALAKAWLFRELQ